MQNALTRHLVAVALVLGALLMVVPARAEPAAAPMRSVDSLVQPVQYYGRSGYDGRPRFYGRPHYYGRPGFYGRSRYYGGPRFYGPRRSYYGRRGYYR